MNSRRKKIYVMNGLKQFHDLIESQVNMRNNDVIKRNIHDNCILVKGGQHRLPAVICRVEFVRSREITYNMKALFSKEYLDNLVIFSSRLKPKNTTPMKRLKQIFDIAFIAHMNFNCELWILSISDKLDEVNTGLSIAKYISLPKGFINLRKFTSDTCEWISVTRACSILVSGEITEGHSSESADNKCFHVEGAVELMVKLGSDMRCMVDSLKRYETRSEANI
ncbi:unnamed protein product [Lepeophtheirus salmonis]|uniref:(salmon louse) hypothetical protein n=1 Tax=Lepeophtheirus salmonis TaxID=72036 RepID=A0A7R8CEA2_LEPSM|nr:unnamed protein product [Lepeophtheirus salmonis]CAF2793550.1 unnamed protein product [Lepeophtheirus salmonis]